MLGHGKLRVDLPRDLPGDGIFNVKQPGQFSRIFKRRGQPQLVHFQHLRLHLDAILDASSCLRGIARTRRALLRNPIVQHVITADDHVVGIQILRNADGRGTGRPEVGRQA